MDFNCNGDAGAAAVGPNRRCATVTLNTAGAAAVVDGICDRDIFCKTKGVEPFRRYSRRAQRRRCHESVRAAGRIPANRFHLSVCEILVRALSPRTRKATEP